MSTPKKSRAFNLLVTHAPTWTPGPQLASALVYYAGVVYRVKTNLANGTTSPDADVTHYEALSGKPTPAQLSGTVIKFDQDAIYAPLYSDTYTFDTSTKRVGVCVFAYFGIGSTAPPIPSGFTLLPGSAAYASGVKLRYSFLVSPFGDIEYFITQLP